MGIKICVVGSINVDLVTNVTRFPYPGETIIGGDLKTIAGVKGANQAVAAARLGAEVTMVGRIGDDVFASQLKTSFIAEGINVSHISASADTATGVALILVDKSGQNSIVVASGANAKVTPKDIEKATEAIVSSDVLLLQLEIPLESVLRAARIGHEHGVKVILNPAPAGPLPGDLFSTIDIFVPNENEAITLVRTRNSSTVIDPGEKIVLVTELRGYGADTVILTAGEEGAYLAEEGGTRRFPAFSLDQVVDTTAAGDAFVGGLATAIAEDRTLPEAVLWGNAAGMLAATRIGAQPSLPSRMEVEAVLERATTDQRQGVRM